MQTGRRVVANPQIKPTDLGCESADKWVPPSISTIAICYYYPARKLVLILPSHGGWKAESTYALQEGCPRLYIAVAVVISNWPRPVTPQSIMPSLNHCDLQRHVGVNNLPKVVTPQRRGRELNSQPSSCKSNALTTRLPSHPTTVLHYARKAADV